MAPEWSKEVTGVQRSGGFWIGLIKHRFECYKAYAFDCLGVVSFLDDTQAALRRLPAVRSYETPRQGARYGVEYRADSTRGVKSGKGGAAQEVAPQENRQSVIGATPIIIVVAVILVLVAAVGAVLWFLVKNIAKW